MKFSSRSLAFKLSFAISLLLLLLFLLLAAVLGTYWMRKFNAELSARGMRSAREVAASLDNILVRSQATAQLLTRQLDYQLPDEAGLKHLTRGALEELIAATPEMVGVNVAFEPYGFDAARQYYSLLTFLGDDDKIHQRQIGGDALPYFYRDWYIMPRTLRRGFWTVPFFSEGGINTWLLGYSTPFFRNTPKGREFAGVVVTDIDIRRLRPLLIGAGVDGVGYGFLVSQFGQVISHPEPRMEFNQTLFTLIAEYNDPVERELARNLQRTAEGESHFTRLPFFDGGTRIFHATCLNGWKVCVAIPADWVYYRLLRYLMLGIAGYLAITVLSVLAIAAVTRRISRPLVRLTAAAATIGQGNFNTRLPEVRSGDEIGMLTAAFHRMQDELGDYVRLVAKNVAARERIEGELSAARNIQRDILPKLLPPLPDNPDFSLAAVLRPARAIGGDLYDVFLRDPDHLVVLIGDVSGKGIPAALFMAVAQTLHRNIAAAGGTPGEVITRLNRMLAQNNNAMMFLTCWMGILELSTGHLSYCNAGHNPPLLLHAGDCAFLETLHGAPLGLLEAVYGDDRLELAPDDTLVLYTDGVTEAFNAAGEMFDHRLEAHAADLAKRGAGPTAVRDELLDAVSAFTGDCEQSDDITMLIVRYNHRDA